MKIIRYPHKYSPLDKRSAITIGNFDGVHLGHQHLIKHVLSTAKKENLKAVVVSMRPYPEQFFSNKKNFFRISTVRQQAEILNGLGVDTFCVLNFNTQLAQMKAHTFFNEIVVSGLSAKVVVVGDDFRFGANRQGDFQLLNSLCQSNDMRCIQMDSCEVDNIRVSSTSIRGLLSQGDVESANRLLGYPYNVCGRVRHGKKLGRTLGFPTLNLRISEDFVLRGIFVVSVIHKGQTHRGVASIGSNPTVELEQNKTQLNRAVLLEVHVFDFNARIYGHQVQVLFHKKIRNEVKFDNLKLLQDEMNRDAREALLYFQKNQFN